MSLAVEYSNTKPNEWTDPGSVGLCFSGLRGGLAEPSFFFCFFLLLRDLDRKGKPVEQDECSF